MDSEVWVYTGEDGGRERRAWLRSADYTNDLLLAELAGLWVRHAAAQRWRYGTAAGAAGAIRDLVRFTDTKMGQGGATLTGPRDDFGPVLLAWRDDVRGRGLDKRWRALIVLARRAAYEGLTLQRTVMLAVTQAGWAYDSARADAPLDEFSNRERILQMRTATADVSRCEERLARGQALYHSDERFRTLLHLARTERSYGEVWRALRESGDLFAQVQGAYGDAIPSSASAVRVLGSLIAPTPLELMSFRVLLGWATGVAPEQIREAFVGDLRFGPNGVYWTSVKRRASKVLKMEFEGTEPWKVAGLWRRVVDATAEARHFTGEDRVFSSFTTGYPFALNFKPVPHPSPTLRDWALHHRVELSEPFDLRRIRKAVKAVRAGVASSAEEAARPDHSLKTFGHHYAATTTTLTRSGSIIIRAQERVVVRTLAKRATVIPSAASNYAVQGVGDHHTGELAARVVNRSEPERAMGATACRDPESSPFEENGKMCTKAPFTCMVCPNAVIFNDHAPQLMLMRDALAERRFALTPEDFADHSFPILEAIEDYLGQMDAATLESAAKLVADGREQLILPLPNRINL